MIEPGGHARHGFRGAEEEPVQVRGDHRRPVRERDLADETDTLNAGIVDENVETPRRRIDRREGCRHARGIRNVGLEIDDSLPRLRRGGLVQREDARAVGEQSLGDGVPDPARCAGHDRDAPPKANWTCLHPQYINQPPLTLIVAPVI
jgi:hypothetical protein